MSSGAFRGDRSLALRAVGVVALEARLRRCLGVIDRHGRDLQRIDEWDPLPLQPLGRCDEVAQPSLE